MIDVWIMGDISAYSLIAFMAFTEKHLFLQNFKSFVSLAKSNAINIYLNIINTKFKN